LIFDTNLKEKDATM